MAPVFNQIAGNLAMTVAIILFIIAYIVGSKIMKNSGLMNGGGNAGIIVSGAVAVLLIGNFLLCYLRSKGKYDEYMEYVDKEEYGFEGFYSTRSLEK